MPAFKLSIYHKLKISYIIRLVIIKHVLVRKFNDTLVYYDNINLNKNALSRTNQEKGISMKTKICK
jgi:hypothetical protein